MATITKMQFEKFVADNEPSWLKKHRFESFNRMNASDMPNFKHGLNIQINPDLDFDALSPKNKSNNQLNIDYDKDSGVKAYSNLDKNIGQIKMFLTREWEDKEDNNKIYYFNQAFVNDLLFIYIPKNAELREPINIGHIINDSPAITQIFILAGSGSRSQVLVNKSGGRGYLGETVRIISRPESKIEFITLQNLNKESISFQKRKALCDKGSDVRWVDIFLGGKYTNNSVTSILGGKGSSTGSTVLYLGTNAQRYDLYTASIHRASDTRSDILTKGVLNNQSRALSHSLIRIEKNANNSNGYEKQDALLLSDQAEADAIPHLEINNHNVKCGHGSSIGQIDADKMFYLMTRGLSEDKARQKIVEGYFTQILDLFEDKSLKDMVYTNIIHSLGLA